MMKTEQSKMFYGARPYAFEKGRALRKLETRCEKILWERLQGKQVAGLRFRRQHAIGPFIVDFYCHPVKLVVEVDGEIHNEPHQIKHDIERSQQLRAMNIVILRFTNDQVVKQIEMVVDTIASTCVALVSARGGPPLQGARGVRGALQISCDTP